MTYVTYITTYIINITTFITKMLSKYNQNSWNTIKISLN